MSQLGESRPGLALPGRAIDRDAIRRYAEAIGDGHEAHRTGDVAPPMFTFTHVLEALSQASGELLGEAQAVIHRSHSVALARPIVPGDQLSTALSLVASETSRLGELIEVRADLLASHNGPGPVCTHTMTFLVVGGSGRANAGEGGPVSRPAATVPSGNASPVVEDREPVGIDKVVAYAQASGDHQAIHLDDDAARAAGLPGAIVHGSYLLARAGVVVEGFVPHGSVVRLGATFSHPVPRGAETETSVWDLGRVSGRQRFAFRVRVAGGSVALKSGLAETA